MKQYILQEDHQGIPANTILEERKIPDTNKTWYYPIGIETDSKFCFYESYIISNPDLFKEVIQNT